MGIVHQSLSPSLGLWTVVNSKYEVVTPDDRATEVDPDMHSPMQNATPRTHGNVLKIAHGSKYCR